MHVFLLLFTVLSSIVADSVDSTKSEEKVRSNLDSSLPGTPMGSDGSESLVVSLSGSLSSGKSNSHFSTRAQITTPSNVKVGDGSLAPSPDNETDDQV